MAQCYDCGTDFKVTSSALYCACCGAPFCKSCLHPPVGGRKGEYLCNSCRNLIVARFDDEGREALFCRIDDQRMRKATSKSALISRCSKPDCGRDLEFKEGRNCIFCQKGFCPECLAFDGEFRRTDFICEECRQRIEEEILLFKEPAPDGCVVLKELGPIHNLKARTPEATKFFFKWMAVSRGGNAVLGCTLSETEKAGFVTGSAKAAKVKK